MSISLRTKLTLAVSALLVILVFGIVYPALLYHERQTKEVIGARQLAMLHTLVHELDRKLAIARDLLVSASRVVPAEALRDPDTAQRFLDQRVELHSLFDNHLSLFTAQGRLIAESPFLPSRRGLDRSDREYFKRTVAAAGPYISEPYATTHGHLRPVIMFTAPVLDGKGHLVGVLAGSVSLLEHNFLGRLAEAPPGAQGHYYLVNDQRVLVLHHDAERVLTRVPPEEDPALDRALDAGFQGSAETETSAGLPVLASFQRLDAKPNWVLAASYPLKEAYAPIERMRQHVIGGTAIGVVLIFLASTLLLRRLTRPLDRLTEHAHTLAMQGSGPPLPESHRGDELGELARSINRLLQTLDAQKAALRESEQRYRIIADFSTHMPFWRAPEGEIRYISPNCARMTGYADTEFYGDPGLLDRLVHPEDQGLWLQHWERARRPAEPLHGSVEFRIVTRAGEVRWVSHSCRRIVEPDGSFLGLRGSHADITERKRIEQALRESEERLAEAVRIARLGSWRLDLQTGEITVSPEHFRMMGDSDDPPAAGRVLPIAEYIRNYIHPDDHPAMQERYEFARQHGRDSDYRDRFEYRLLHRDGSTRTVSVSAHAVPGERRLIHGIAQDITERKEAERAFAELSRWQEQILKSAGEGILGLDREGRQVFVNPAAARMLGVERAAELVGRLSHPLWHHSHADGSPYPAEQCPIYDSLKDGRVRQLDTEVFWRRDGTCFPAAYTSTPIFEAGGIAGAVVVFEDITERKRAEEALRESEARLQAIIESEPECVKLLDREGRVLEMNPAGLAMLEAEASQVVGRPMRDMVLADYREAFDALTARVFEGQPGELEFEIEGVRARRLWLDTRAVPLRSAEGAIVACLGVTRDITERKRIQQQLQHDALHDGLTGLPNRVLFLDRLNQSLERARRRPDYAFAVLFLDLDRFKVVNDSLGHLVGDQLLIDIARRLERCVRPTDTVARLGGDEFSLLLDDTADPSDATRVVERIERTLAKPFRHEGQEVFSSASIGIAMSAMGYEHPEELMRDADTAMYRAKSGGRSRFQVFDAAMHQHAIETLRLETDLRYALERDQLKVYYQPIVDVGTGCIHCLEALLRWEHPARGLIMPAEFIPAAEETGLVVPIGAWVLQAACRELRKWQSRWPEYRELAVAVNLSTRQFLQADLGNIIRGALEKTGLSGRHLKLEVTESMIMENPEVASALLMELQALGVRACVDDFGTGYSSLSRLQGLPIDTLKVDKSFVARMHTGGNHLELVRGIVGLAHSLGMNVVAEGVETRVEFDLLSGLGCEYAQGYLLASPVPAAAVEALLHETTGQARATAALAAQAARARTS